MTLKYEDKFVIGERIRSYDFQPMEDRGNCFVEGEIIEINSTAVNHKSYLIQVDRDCFAGRERNIRIGQFVYVPMGVSFGEFTDRVTRV